MPLKLNIGLSRKVGEANYGSRGASVNVEIEAESALVADPGRFQAHVRRLFDLVRSSIADELNGNGQTTGPDGAKASNGSRQTMRQATQSQVKALHAITKSQNRDLDRLLHDRFEISRPEDLSLQQASALIDELKNGQQRRTT